MSKKSRKNKEAKVAQQAAPVEKTEETVAANEAAEVTPPVKDERTKDERRRDRLALKVKARSEALEQGLPWDDNFKAIMFEENYENAFKQATESPHAIDADILKASDAKIAGMGPPAPVTANDNTETSTEQQPEPEQEAPAEETTESPVDDTPAEEAPIVEAIVDPNLKREGESTRQWKQRLHRQSKATAQATTFVEPETRNGDAPAETTKPSKYPTGDLIHHSDYDGNSVTLPAKSDKDAANVFETAAMGATDEPATNAPKEEPGEQEPKEADVPLDTIIPAEAPVEERVEPQTVESDTTSEVPDTSGTKKRETLKLVSTSTPKQISENSKGYVDDAKKFYGAAFTEERAADLTDAYRMLCMAIRSEASGSVMSGKAIEKALKHEQDAFAIGVEMKKAA